MLGFYNYTVVLTYLGMLISFLGISFTMTRNIHSALICLMISGLCDMFDGAIASTKIRTPQEKRFGIQIDSLSDLICFGIFPALIVYQAFSDLTVVFYIAGFYTLCALIRLAFFNVDEEERQEQTQEARKVYRGLPVTTVALILPALFCICRLLSWPPRIAAPAVLFLMAVAFLTPFPLKKPAFPGKISMVACGAAELLLLIFSGVDV